MNISRCWIFGELEPFFAILCQSCYKSQRINFIPKPSISLRGATAYSTWSTQRGFWWLEILIDPSHSLQLAFKRPNKRERREIVRERERERKRERKREREKPPLFLIKKWLAVWRVWPSTVGVWVCQNENERQRASVWACVRVRASTNEWEWVKEEEEEEN